MKSKILLLLLCLGACSKPNPADDGDGDLTARAQEAYNTSMSEMIMDNLCRTDTLENGTVQRVIRVGGVLDELKPTVYSCGVKSLEEAERIFRQLIPLEEQSIIAGTCAIDGFGTLKFTPSTEAGVFAVVDINIPQVPEITQLRLTDEALWPENPASPFLRGQIWRHNPSGRRYLCVTNYQNRNNGLMITFDGGWTDMPGSDQRPNVYKSYNTWWKRGTYADERALYGLFEMKYYEYNAYAAAMKQLGMDPVRYGKETYWVEEHQFHDDYDRWIHPDHHTYRQWFTMSDGRTHDYRACYHKDKKNFPPVPAGLHPAAMVKTSSIEFGVALEAGFTIEYFVVNGRFYSVGAAGTTWTKIYP